MRLVNFARLVIDSVSKQLRKVWNAAGAKEPFANVCDKWFSFRAFSRGAGGLRGQDRGVERRRHASGEKSPPDPLTPPPSGCSSQIWGARSTSSRNRSNRPISPVVSLGILFPLLLVDGSDVCGSTRYDWRRGMDPPTVWVRGVPFYCEGSKAWLFGLLAVNPSQPTGLMQLAWQRGLDTYILK